jgi:hypothetical protein
MHGRALAPPRAETFHVATGATSWHSTPARSDARGYGAGRRSAARPWGSRCDGAAWLLSDCALFEDEACWRAHPSSIASKSASSKRSGRTPSPKTRANSTSTSKSCSVSTGRVAEPRGGITANPLASDASTHPLTGVPSRNLRCPVRRVTIKRAPQSHDCTQERPSRLRLVLPARLVSVHRRSLTLRSGRFACARRQTTGARAARYGSTHP